MKRAASNPGVCLLAAEVIRLKLPDFKNILPPPERPLQKQIAQADPSPQNLAQSPNMKFHSYLIFCVFLEVINHDKR